MRDDELEFDKSGDELLMSKVSRTDEQSIFWWSIVDLGNLKEAHSSNCCCSYCTVSIFQSSNGQTAGNLLKLIGAKVVTRTKPN